jgi:hypothetical protein
VKATLVREVHQVTPSGQHAGRFTETVEVDIVFPERMAPPQTYAEYGEWRVAIPARILAEPR